MNPTSISVRSVKSTRILPDLKDLGFGKYFTDHMFVAKYSDENGWSEAEVKPYEPLQLDPASSVLHYGQALFEGMKAFKQTDQSIALFRPDFNWQRLCQGAERLCMIAPPKELFIEGIKKLVEVDKKYVPDFPGSLYIRPTLVGTEPFLGVRPSAEFLFFVILSPVSNYYGNSTKPVKIWIERNFLRAAPGGLGATKAAANYAASLKAAQDAKQRGYSQVLWLDITRKNIEEVGTMNVFFVFENEIVTPSLSGTILEGGTRAAVLELLKSQNLKVSERQVSIAEIENGAKSGALKEVFGTGTAAVITPVGELGSDSGVLTIGNGEMGPISTKIYQDLTGIQFGKIPDKWGWLQRVSP